MQIYTFFRKFNLSANAIPAPHHARHGHGTGYYGYKWAEVLDADAFSYFKEKGIFSREVADSFRENVLSKGGSEYPMDLYVRFRGHKPETKALIDRMGLNH